MNYLEEQKFEAIDFVLKDRVAFIYLDRSKTMNAINQKMRQEILYLMEEIEMNDHIKVVVLGAKGKGFSSGGDLVEGLAGYETVEDKILAEYVPIFEGIQRSSKLYIASIHGACAGIASGVALAADLAIMSESAYFYVPFAGLNLVPDGGVSYQLVRHLGYKKAMEVFLNAERIKAQDCEKFGIVNSVVADDELENNTQAWAVKLAEGAPLSHSLGKRCMQFAMENTLVDTVKYEAMNQVTCSQSPITLAAIKSMLNKEKPTFV